MLSDAGSTSHFPISARTLSALLAESCGQDGSWSQGEKKRRDSCQTGGRTNHQYSARCEASERHNLTCLGTPGLDLGRGYQPPQADHPPHSHPGGGPTPLPAPRPSRDCLGASIFRLIFFGAEIAPLSLTFEGFGDFCTALHFSHEPRPESLPRSDPVLLLFPKICLKISAFKKTLSASHERVQRGHNHTKQCWCPIPWSSPPPVHHSHTREL